MKDHPNASKTKVVPHLNKVNKPTKIPDQSPQINQTTPTKESNVNPKETKKLKKSFLSIGAAKSKALKNKRKAASCIGFNDKKKKMTKLSYSGSGVPLNSVIKFKYQKGFTQAVRVPCRIEDLM